MSTGAAYTYAGIMGALGRGAARRPLIPPSMRTVFYRRALSVGIRAAPTAFLMALCVGGVITLVLQAQLATLSMDERVPGIVWIVLTQQLAPLLIAVVFIGRSVSGTAAELANMKISEELKALETMGIDLSRYLLLPILGAFLVMLPVMEIYTLGVGLIGAWGVCAMVMGMSAEHFIVRALEWGTSNDILIGAGKAVVFSLVAALIAFHQGLNASGGSDSVGRVATAAVVAALVAVTVVNAVATAVQFMAM
jgi:phospholipid/cholesterol/gamma-HCH transport system permease protein